MHLLRLLLSGAAALRNGTIGVRMDTHRQRLLDVKSGAVSWEHVNDWRKELHQDFEKAFSETQLPERPDYEAANKFLIKARSETASHHRQK
jgi:uncharacterized protein